MPRRQGLSIGRWIACAALLAAAPVASAATNDGLRGGAAAPPVISAPAPAAPASPQFAGRGAVGAPDAAAEEVTIYVSVGPTHTDLIFPRSAFANAPPLVRAAADRAVGGPWIIIGWGPYWFGRRAEGGPFHFFPLLSANAVYTTIVPQFHSQLRVAALDAPGHAPDEHNMTLVPLRMPAADVEKSLERINASFEVGPDGGPVLPDQAGTAPGVTVYRSKEIYHITHECNHWTSEVLRAGGVRVNTVFDVVPATLHLDLKARGEVAKDVSPNPTVASAH